MKILQRSQLDSKNYPLRGCSKVKEYRKNKANPSLIKLKNNTELLLEISDYQRRYRQNVVVNSI